MADVVARSWSEVPQFVQQIWVDATGLVARRKRDGVSYTDLIIDAIVDAVAEVPDVNASYRDGEIVVYEDVNLSVAVATDGGLVVPVVHRAQALDSAERGHRLRELVERAQAGRLAPEDVASGTITLSNLGMYGVETGTPLVTHPQAAIVFAGAMKDRVVAVDGRVEVRPTIGFAVGFDHRVVDGARAATFVAALRRGLEAG
jgi:pyruvate dehydrogenase E2 component (dihydrolipoamide acetyltransferase)